MNDEPEEKSRNLWHSLRNGFEWLSAAKIISKYGLGVILGAVGGLYLVLTTSGKFRIIGVGLLCYSALIVLMIAFLTGYIGQGIYKKGGQLKWAFVCFLLPIPIALYMELTMLSRQEPKIAGFLFTAIPCWLLGLYLVAWWALEKPSDE